MDLRKVRRNVDRYIFAGGVFEITVGGAFMAVSGAAWLLLLATPRGLTGFIAGILPLLSVGAVVGASRAAEWGRERLVYPRTGYVLPQPMDEGRQGLAVLVGGLLLVLIAALGYATNDAVIAVTPLLQGIFVAAGFGVAAYALWLPRLLIAAAFAAASGALLAITPLPLALTAMGIFAGTGVGLIVSGLAGLVAYLRTQPSGATNGKRRG